MSAPQDDGWKYIVRLGPVDPANLIADRAPNNGVHCWRCLDEGAYEVARVRDGEFGVEWYCVREPCRCRSSVEASRR